MLGQRRTKPAKRAAFVLPQDKVEQREKAYLLYQNMGVTRSFNSLMKLMAEKHPELKVSRTTLEKWSRMQDWVQRCELHGERAATTAMPAINNMASTQGLPPAIERWGTAPVSKTAKVVGRSGFQRGCRRLGREGAPYHRHPVSHGTARFGLDRAGGAAGR